MHFYSLEHKPNNKSLIIIFLGWGMDEKPFKNLKKDGFDIVLTWGVSDEDTPVMYNELVGRYNRTIVIAWSYGVATANNLISERETLRIAVNGTTSPVSDTLGIPRHLFAMTLKSVSEHNMHRFYTSMMGKSPLRADFMANKPKRDIEEMRIELQKYGEILPQEPNPMWDKIYIAKNDTIIPPANQESLWQDFDIVWTAESHLPDFQQIIDDNVIDKSLIAKRFSESNHSYETEAEVQRQIAATLHDLSREFTNFSNKEILEIGVGTGFLTRLYAKDADSDKISLLDIAPKENIALAAKSAITQPDSVRIISDDAEEFLSLAENEEAYDIIVSSSTIQWFISPRRFFYNLCKTLRKGGIAAISTFETGTYNEISKFTGRSLTYHTLEQFVAMLPSSLTVEKATRETNVIHFSNGRELLEHIKNTGVNAIGEPLPYTKTRNLIKSLDENPQLTYKNVYLILRKI